MDKTLRTVITQAINSSSQKNLVVSSIDLSEDGTGTITYNSNNIWIDANAPGFVGSTIQITDEEMVRAYLLLRLATTYGYPATRETLEVERVYKPVGRPIGKGGRVDILVRKPSKNENNTAFLFIECKAPSKFDEDLRYIDGQLFRLSRQESTRPRFLIYYTVEYKASRLRERVIVVDTERFPDYESWDHAGQPLTDVIPSKYGQASKRKYANVSNETTEYRPLDHEVSPETFNRLRTEIHDVIWGGVEQARRVMINYRDHLGRPRLPYVIDPSCGSGTFLIEYMKLIRNTIGEATVAKVLPNRIRESHTVWFGGLTGNVWAREYLFGIENNYDLGLAAKVNMVLHGDGSMNTWIKSGLLPLKDYWVQGRNNILGVVQPSTNDNRDIYQAERNDQFDLILSNPPFSIKLSPDEKAKVSEAFQVMASAQSEAIFVERWYQLLRENGSFCCILPEAILDTSTYAFMRYFLLQAFKIEAVISLPYDAFRPFTSTKTCILFATKRSYSDVKKFRSVLRELGVIDKAIPSSSVLMDAIERVGWKDELIFMAEPAYVGYKRRKNLSDLPMPNLLYREDDNGDIGAIDLTEPSTVIEYFRAGPESTRPHNQLGFWSSLGKVAARKGLRFDPKYRWLWDFKDGIVMGNPETAQPLNSFLQLVELPKISKGELEEETFLLDLESVESRQALIREPLPEVDVIGSDKVKFVDCDLLISKLEPYLGKIVISPNPSYIGSTEWVGLKIINDMPNSVAAYFLMLPELCDAYRRLQSGKRHARFDPDEFLSLRVDMPLPAEWEKVASQLKKQRKKIIDMRQEEKSIRSMMDKLFQH
ncbi:MAG TPA: N-6 DNA methylase [Anaerolineales bacterium]|nr:N-6 DNA methylase [Anaerolineales bacterium]